MEGLEKTTYIEKADVGEKHRLIGNVRAKAAEMAKHSDKEDRQAEEALYRVWFRKSKELSD